MTDAKAAPPVKAKVVLVDPSSTTVVWMNESAADGAGGPASATTTGTAPLVSEVVPVAEAMGVPEAVTRVAETGVPEHLSADVVSMGRGSITLATSIYRLPDGMLLVVSENAWQAADATGRERRQGSRRQRGR